MRWLCGLALWLSIGAAGAADATTKALLVGLVDKVNFRHSQEVFALALADLRANSAEVMLAGMGQGAKLPDSWRRGNPHWEKAYARLTTAIEAEETRGGPLFVIGRPDFVAVFNPPWNNEEVETLQRIASTEFGRSYIRLMDLILVPAFVQTFASMKEMSASTVARLRKIENDLKGEFGHLALELQSLEKANSADAERLKDLTGRLTQEEGRKIGEDIMKPSVTRLLNAMYGSMSDLLEIVRGFRETIDNPNNRL